MERIIDHFKQFTALKVFTIYLRYLIGGAFIFAALVKIKGERFTTMPTDTEVGYFFEAMYSTGMYWRFLGLSQLVASILLMTQRFATVGALLFFGIILNITLITISVNFGMGTPVITSLMLLATIYLLLWDYSKLKLLLYPEHKIIVDYSAKKDRFMEDSWWMVLGALLIIVTLVFAYTRTGLIQWFLLCVGIGFLGFAGYFVKEKRMKSRKKVVS